MSVAAIERVSAGATAAWFFIGIGAILLIDPSPLNLMRHRRKIVDVRV
jgi:hypothetical protein